MIVLGSRYQGETLLTTTTPDNRTTQFVMRNTVFAGAATRYHVWRDSDRIDSIAQKFLGSSSLWWEIADLNPEILDPFGIPVGTVLRIPAGA